MKLSTTRVDSALIEQGDWVDSIPDLPGIRIKARGTNNADYRLLEGRLIREIPRTARAEGVSPADQDRITSQLLLDTVVLDIDGITEEDETTPVKYTKELGKTLFFDPDYRVWTAGAAYAGAVIAQRRKAADEADTKN